MRTRLKNYRPNFWSAITAIIFVLFAAFMVIPLFRLLVSGFRDPASGAWSLINFTTFFSRKYYTNAIWNSLSIAVSVTALSVVFGVILAYLLTNFQIKGKRFIQILIIFSMMSPSFIGAYSWVLLLGRSGVLTSFLTNVLGTPVPTIYGFGGIVLVLVLKSYSIIYLFVTGAIRKVDRSLLEASQSLGCRPSLNVLRMMLPLILPTLLSASLMVFMTSIADFGTAMLIGEGYRVLPVLIYREFMSELGSNANFAAAIALIMVVLTAGLYLLQRYIINRKSFKMRSINTIEAKPLQGVKSVLAHLFVYGFVLLSVVPQATVVFTSFMKTKGSRFIEGFSFDSYRASAQKIIASMKNTYSFGAVAIVLIVLLAIFTAYLSVRKRNALTSLLDTVTMFPYIISGSILGIMLLLSFNKPPLILSGTGWIIIAAFVIRRLPHTLRSSTGILYQISPNTEEAAISLGASPAKAFFSVTFITMLPGVLTGAILSWVTVINELSASIILYTGRTATLSVAVYEQVSRANYGNAAAIATVMMVSTVVSLAIFLKVSGNKDISL